MPELRGEDTISDALEASCADEPIHVIGTVQPHGFVLVVDVYTTRIVQVSSGLSRHWSTVADPADLLQASLTDWIDGLDPDPVLQLMSLPTSGQVILMLRPTGGKLVGVARLPGGPADEFEGVGHRVGDVAVLEWQPLGDGLRGVPGSMQGMTELRAAIMRLRSTEPLDVFFRKCIREVARISGFDRVMLYRFLPDWSGEVIAERATRGLKTRFLGLRFPASDIPAQARELFTSSKLRVLADVRAAPDVLLPAQLPDGAALDQSFSLLRGVSEVHRIYLANMGVRATMSLSIICDGRLWGLVACHHYLPRIAPFSVRNALRQVCELLAEFVGVRIEQLSQSEAANNKLLLEHLMNRVDQALLLGEAPKSVLDRFLPQLLAGLDANALYARVGDLRYTGESGGPVEPRNAVFDEVSRLFDASPAPAAVLQRINLLAAGGNPLLSLPAAAGILAARQLDEVAELCAFTRASITTEVSWAGAPVKRMRTLPDGRVVLEPRRSFEVWKETAAGTARDWTRTEGEACERLLRILIDARKRQTHLDLQRILVWRAHHDHLTGLLNRRTLEEKLEDRLREQRYDFALMLIDLDNFKKINDIKGHAVGDQVLKEVSTHLSAAIGPQDTLARVGGDEFMLLVQMAAPEQALVEQLAERLQVAVRVPFNVDGQAIGLGISIGVSFPPLHGTNSTDLMRRADLALYRAKELGRSRAVVFDPGLERSLVGSYEIERELAEAIGSDQLSLAFQPEIDLRSGRVVGLEALARWMHPARGAIPPAVFIPIAERSGLITRFGQWVVHTAISTQAGWHAQGCRKLPVAVNVSMAEVTSGKLVEHIARVLTEFRVSPECLCIELTESVIMSDPVLSLKVLRGLRHLGITTALDDFGTGYSSLSHLRQLPLTCLKVDQSFTAALMQDAPSRSLMHAILCMAGSLHMTTIAEGVETLPQLQWLVDHDCNVGQGFLFGHAVPAQDVHALIGRIETSWPCQP